MNTIKLILFLVMALSVSIFAQNYQVDWYVIASGGGVMASTNYGVSGTIGQPITGRSQSTNYTVESGFWVGAGGAGPACDYAVGDVNGNGSYNGLDITYGVTYLKGGPPPLYECDCPPHGIWYVSADVNASCSYNGLDITYGVGYFKGGPLPMPCADCPPGGAMVTSVGSDHLAIPVYNAEKIRKSQILKGH